jgi:hypothetical protein
VPGAFIRFTDFGDSLKFFNYFWSEELFRVENIKSDIESKYLNYLKKTALLFLSSEWFT